MNMRYGDDRSAATVSFLAGYEKLVRLWVRELTSEAPALFVKKVDRHADTQGLREFPEDPNGIGGNIMNPTAGYYAVRFYGTSKDATIRITSNQVPGPLHALDNVLGSNYSGPQPMLIDVLDEFTHVDVKLVARNAAGMRSARKLQAALADKAGWVKPSYPAEMVARAKRQIAKSLRETGEKTAI